MISFDAATRLLLAAAAPLGQETVPLAHAHGRVLARPVLAAITSPRTDVSTMDGYAVRGADLATLPVQLPLHMTLRPGDPAPPPLPPGACARVFTGAPLPAGADRVVMQEIVTEADGLALFAQAPGDARFVRRAGSDFQAGEPVLQAGTLLRPGALAAMAGADVAAANCWRRPHLALVATGDELTEPGEAGGRPGSIPDSITAAVAALATEWGGHILATGRLPDRLPLLRKGAAAALAGADVVVVTGGASVGAHDHARAMFESEGFELLFSRVAMKPGKPVWLGRARGRLVLGLPGNPGSALVTARLFLAPLLGALTGRDPRAALGWEPRVLATPLSPGEPREVFWRAITLPDGRVEAVTNQDSGAQSPLALADCLVRQPIDAPALPAGSPVAALRL